MQQAQHLNPGVSGLSLYLPALRIPLEAWCKWYDVPWGKISKTVGRSFRMPGPHEDVYTMAANAALRLIRNYRIDPGNIGYLALGTESSKDNSAGAVIVRGMIDRALEAQGLPRLSRNCEIPEFKHACLGGIYALKGALRYVSFDGEGRQALVINADVAEYARNSSGEPTQGAGAVAMLVESEPRLFSVDLKASGSASDYRGPDFRKPFARHFFDSYEDRVNRVHDFPIFSGRYSTHAYLDEVLQAVRHMWQRQGVSGYEALRDTRAFFFHRPYQMMPVQGLAFLQVAAMADSVPGRDELAEHCAAAGIDMNAVLQELGQSPDLYQRVLDGNATDSPYPAAAGLANHVRKSESFSRFCEEKMSLGRQLTQDFGNLYTAALPAWLAAGAEEALEKGVELAGQPMVMVGYGSGDAAEAIPIRFVQGWQESARVIGAGPALANAIDLTQAQYEALHDGYPVEGLEYQPSDECILSHTGDTQEPGFQDLGVDYYDYVATQTA